MGAWFGRIRRKLFRDPVLLLLLIRPLLTWAQDAELMASSQFNMVLGPISDRLDLNDLQVIEDAIATGLLSFVSDPIEYWNIEVVIQESDFLDSQPQPSIQIRFFVLATTPTPATASTTLTQADTMRVQLNELVEYSLFGTPQGRETFLNELRQRYRPALLNVSSVKVAPLAPGTSSVADKESSRKPLSNLDIILIVVSGLILLSVLYMIFQHHRDQGFFENQRLMGANERILSGSQNIIGDDSTSLPSLPIADTENGDGDNGARSRDIPLTPSTIHSYEQAPPDEKPSSAGNLLVKAESTTNGRLPFSASDGPSNDTSGNIVTYLAADGESTHNLNATRLDDSHWFPSSSIFATAKRDNKTSSRTTTEVDGIGTNVNTMQDEVRDTTSTNSNDSSDDAFFIDVDNASRSSVAGSSNNRSHASSTAIAEWMKSIRVLRTPSPLVFIGNSNGGSDSKTSEMAPPSSQEVTSLSSSTSEAASSGNGAAARALQGLATSGLAFRVDRAMALESSSLDAATWVKDQHQQTLVTEEYKDDNLEDSPLDYSPSFDADHAPSTLLPKTSSLSQEQQHHHDQQEHHLQQQLRVVARVNL